MTKRRKRVTYYVSKAGRDLSKKRTSKRRRSQAGKILANHKRRYH